MEGSDKGTDEYDFSIEQNVSCDDLYNATREAWQMDGLIHREGAPSVIYRDENGVVKREEYYHHGQRHRENGLPAIVDIFHQRKEWFEYDQLHRENGPAIYCYDGTEDRPYSQAWYYRGQEHRKAGPSGTIDSGQVLELEMWKRHGVLHREDGPAHVERDPQTGIITDELWRRNGEPYRRGGKPHTIIRDGKTGEIVKLEGGTFEALIDLPQNGF